MENSSKGRLRYIICIAFIAVLFILFEARLFEWQIVKGEDFANISASQNSSFIKLEATRGEILDRNGVVLAGNDMTYRVLFSAITMEYDRNPTIIKLISLLESRDESWNDTLPIIIDENGEYAYDEDKEGEIAYLKSKEYLNLQEYATADDCMSELIEKYNANGYSKEDTRNLLSIRYGMFKDQFSRAAPFVISYSVSIETVGVLNEMSNELPGVETDVGTIRHYGEDGSLAPHIIGTTGTITPGQYERAKEEENLYSSENVAGYSLTDTTGRNGIEYAFEDILRGKNGKEDIIFDAEGNIQRTATTEAPEPGQTVYLTLDANLQKATNESLAKNIENNTKYPDNIAGAAVAIDIATGGVLASSTYPNYDLNLYNEDDAYIKALNEDDTKPMFNRALDGAFAPGSSFKPLVAIAALQEGDIGEGTGIYCDGAYHFYSYANFEPGCLGTHGTVSVRGALAQSCNVFFYESGRRLTIEKMDAYASYFALGEYTGIELPEEKGLMSNPKDFERINGSDWVAGNTVSAAIGQLDDSFTPMQLATYAATIANGGKRLQTHFLDKITDYAREEIVEDFEPNVVADAGISDYTIAVVMDGMNQVATWGTAKDVFGGYEYSICAKTGTAETYGNKSDHLTFIAIAPYENPEIAVSVVLEYGGKGSNAMEIAKDMLDEYFGIEREDEDSDGTDEDDSDGADDNTDEQSDTDTDATDENAQDKPKTKNGGPNAKVGAFYDPEKDARKPESEIIDNSTAAQAAKNLAELMDGFSRYWGIEEE